MKHQNFLALALCLAASAAMPGAAQAGTFIGLGQPGPAGWSIQLYPTWHQPLQSPTSAFSFVELSYFTPTGFTGTARDRHQFWAAAALGYATPAPRGDDRATGVMGQQLAYEYYYNAIERRTAHGLSWWTTPYIAITVPNGDTKASGFGAGGNQHSYLLGWNNHFGWDKWSITFAPVLLSYADRSRHADAAPADGAGPVRARAGLSLTLADLAIGYRVSPELDLGVHHSYSLYNRGHSDFAASRQARVGPSFAYHGLMQTHRIYLAGNLSVDYLASPGLKRTTTLSAVLVKFF
ncbi:MAG: hypothetical protein JOY84_13335 [Curvibacter sp.]|nr:hypothetical protein [Curvibacter sp.]